MSDTPVSTPPEGLLPGIRNGARAVIMRDAQVLFLHKRSPMYGERYVLPGGSQDLGETLEQALDRECREEIGTGIEILDLLHVADFFKPRDTTPPTWRHQVEFLFTCAVPDDYVPHAGIKPDRHQIDVVWLPIEALDTKPVFPEGLPEILGAMTGGERPVYLRTMG